MPQLSRPSSSDLANSSPILAISSHCRPMRKPYTPRILVDLDSTRYYDCACPILPMIGQNYYTKQLTDMMHVLRSRGSSLPPPPHQQPPSSVSQGVHVLQALRADSLASVDIFQPHPYIYGAPVG